MSGIFEAIACRSIGLAPTPEYQFAPPRKWRFDWAFKRHKIALEIEGGIWTRGRHTRGSGFIKDMEKYSEAAIMGWRVIRVTPQQFESGEAILMVQRALKYVPGAETQETANTAAAANVKQNFADSTGTRTRNKQGAISGNGQRKTRKKSKRIPEEITSDTRKDSRDRQ